MQGGVAAVWQLKRKSAVPAPLPACKLYDAAVCWVLRCTLYRSKLQSASHSGAIRPSHSRLTAYIRLLSLFFVFMHIVTCTITVTNIVAVTAIAAGAAASAAAIAIVTTWLLLLLLLLQVLLPLLLLVLLSLVLLLFTTISSIKRASLQAVHT